MRRRYVQLYSVDRIEDDRTNELSGVGCFLFRWCLVYINVCCWGQGMSSRCSPSGDGKRQVQPLQALRHMQWSLRSTVAMFADLQDSSLTCYNQERNLVLLGHGYYEELLKRDDRSRSVNHSLHRQRWEPGRTNTWPH
jgi:hypothetical protein